MAQQYATGAVHCYVKNANLGSQVNYLGTCEQMPQDSRSPEYEMLMNDLSGSKVPLDMAFEGVSAQVSMVLTRWDNTVAEALTKAPSTTGIGSYSYSDVGTLMSLEGQCTEIWLAYTFTALNPKAVYATLPKGRHYIQSVLWSPQLDETGTKPMKRHFMFYAWPKYVPLTKKFTLYVFLGFDNLPQIS